ncbi:hypothetical protein ASC61_02415 [Aeromicrobium sp. Root344]|uniref:DUF3558 domain-containing protein n=1 Tax=Aeromicrobium sp. Root344 TaxID=1736521 RepID=UPI0006F58ED3|nr:DUF3558 domain-containing protein [Aeromicrobium sp. Root344]KQV73949.1 hypothetical protein ASC61_02415 [Aeromicrobium sp. Root344]
MPASLSARTFTAVTMLVALAACGSSSGGDKAPASNDKPAAASTSSAPKIPDDLCSTFTADELGAVVGATVTTETQPGGGCGFKQEDPRAVSGSITAMPDDAGTGGFEGAQSGAAGAMDSPKVVMVDGVGTKAFLAFGTVFGGESLQTAGGTTDGKVIAIITLQQAKGLQQPALEDLGRKLLALADDKLH